MRNDKDKKKECLDCLRKLLFHIVDLLAAIGIIAMLVIIIFRLYGIFNKENNGTTPVEKNPPEENNSRESQSR